jgi:multiple sugar transport system substrate-binding protein
VDELRDIARRVIDGADTYGIFVPGKDPDYLNQLVNRLAQSAGAAGTIDWTDGEYIQDTQPFLDAFDFLKSLLDDDLLHPASPSMGTRDARARWASGEAAIYPWGAWFIGGLMVDEPEAVERGVACWHLPGPESERHKIYSGPSGGVFWVSADAREPEAGAQLLHQMTTPEFQEALASAMDQPPALLEAVEKADVHPAYQQCISTFTDDVLIAPAPAAGEPGVWRVEAEMRDIRPNPGDILQSVLAGEDVNVRQKLTTFRDSISKERERAIESVQDDAKVDISAWVFENWDPSRDYEQADYDER